MTHPESRRSPPSVQDLTLKVGKEASSLGCAEGPQGTLPQSDSQFSSL